MASLTFAQTLFSLGPTQNKFKRLYVGLLDLAKGVVAPSPPDCATAYTVGA